VMNITPNSFSDGGELDSVDKIRLRLKSFGTVHALDIGAESTAPKNASIDHLEEWARWQMLLPLLPQLSSTLSADTYHPETVFKLVKLWKDQKIAFDFIWNDVSGKFDDNVKDFLKEGSRFHYVYCHNRAPSRDLSGRHMDFVNDDGRIEEELLDFFGPRKHERVIFDPCLGFSKSFEENWFILNHFKKFQQRVSHERWLLGISRKSFLKKKFGTEDREELDRLHAEVLRPVLATAEGELWVRTHRPELLPC
jgi:dihydropteroate synthase